jgi:hypothetical protein
MRSLILGFFLPALTPTVCWACGRNCRSKDKTEMHGSCCHGAWQFIVSQILSSGGLHLYCRWRGIMRIWFLLSFCVEKPGRSSETWVFAGESGWLSIRQKNDVINQSKDAFGSKDCEHAWPIKSNSRATYIWKIKEEEERVESGAGQMLVCSLTGIGCWHGLNVSERPICLSWSPYPTVTVWGGGTWGGG